jgi:hypothetical protein
MKTRTGHAKGFKNNYFRVVADEKVFYGCFDPGSLMCYSAKETMLADKTEKITAQRVKPSFQDKAMLNALYPFYGHWSGVWIIETFCDNYNLNFTVFLKQDKRDISGDGHIPAQIDISKSHDINVTGKITDFHGESASLEFEWGGQI